MLRETKILIAVFVIFAVSLVAIFAWESGWVARQTWVILFTGLVVMWYTYETTLLRRTSVAQLELQLRPFVVLEPVDNGFHLRNLGPGVALNVEVLDVLLSEQDRIGVRFPERVAIMECGPSRIIQANSYHGDVDAGDFFAAHLDPQYAVDEFPIRIQFRDFEMKKYETKEKVKPGTLEITGLTKSAL